jgi:hypothetical protein
MQGCIFDRVATGDSNDDFALTWTGGNRCAIQVMEFSGNDATPYEDSAEDLTNVNSTGTTQDTGSATATNADGVAVAGIGGYDESGWQNENLAIDNSFTGIQWASNTGGRPIAAMAYKIYSSATSHNPRWSTIDVGTYTYGCIGIYKASGGGGPTVSPFGHHLLDRQYAAIAAHRLGGLLQ